MIGVLNHYKLVQVAKRLVERGWPASEEALLDGSLYDFTAEAEKLTREAANSKSATERLSKLRKAFFLDNGNDSTRELLAELYRQEGYEAQALFYGGADASVRDSFIEKKKQVQKIALEEFVSAVANADLETMANTLGSMNELEKKRFSALIFAASLGDSTTYLPSAIRPLPPAKQKKIATGNILRYKCEGKNRLQSN